MASPDANEARRDVAASVKRQRDWLFVGFVGMAMMYMATAALIVALLRTLASDKNVRGVFGT